MKKLFVALFLLAIQLHAATSLVLEWGPSPDDCSITNFVNNPLWCVNNYRLYWGPSSGNYNGFSDVGQVTNTTFTQLVPGFHYYFVVTAMNAWGAESDPSNEIDFQMPGQKIGSPTNLQFRFTVQTSSNLVTWQDSGSAVMESPNPAAFYRLLARHAPVEPALESGSLSAASLSVSAPVKAPFTSRQMRRQPAPPAP